MSRDSEEIRLFPSQKRERETIGYRPGNNENNHVRHHVKMRPLDDLKNARFFGHFFIILLLFLLLLTLCLKTLAPTTTEVDFHGGRP